MAQEGILWILRAQRDSNTATLKPKYILCSYMGSLGLRLQQKHVEFLR